ncbi:MAG: type III PLP-dependent enzyme [Candidatus Devosia phytovorans]|uniref:Type III PLP-dependent enzyme n=1 Tax=Candidatus Devosia phytovorans TaxID=3121372 RepID=A0AAJ6AZE3_9HYPH|nr:type III PLP-dependent enzyme [Devosia sp.]WEK03711.1 MAG: type III PLP-dependent enzyme [Devosia sp.]
MLQPWTDLDPMLADAAERFVTPSYLYVADRIETRLAELEQNFGKWFALSYAVKANPNPALLGWLRGRVPYLDVSSIGEVRRATSVGWPASELSFTGPAKRQAEIEEAIAFGVGELVLESLEEAETANDIARSLGRRQSVLVRLAPDHVPKGFGDHMAGRPSPFGIDVEDAEPALRQIAAMDHLHVVGLHIYSGTQSLKPAAVIENWRIFLAEFRRFSEMIDLVPERLVFGSGLGIPHHAGDVALDTAEIAAGIAEDLEQFKKDSRFAGTELVLELGRHLVGEAGVFLTRVLRVKPSRGAQVVLCDGGMNAHLAATGQFGMVLRRNYLLHRVGGGKQLTKYDIHGPLCTSIDRLAAGAELPVLTAGDLIAIHPSGAYGPTASPMNFISHPLPRELFAEGGQVSDVTPWPA